MRYSEMDGFREFREAGKLKYSRQWALNTPMNPKKKVFFHGTSSARIPDILKNGLCNKECRIDKTATYEGVSCNQAIYLTQNFSAAQNYARSSAKALGMDVKGGKPVVLMIKGYDLRDCEIYPDWNTMTTWTHEIDGAYEDVVVMGCGCITPEKIMSVTPLGV